MRTTPSAAMDAAAALLSRFVARGVRHIVVSPGSRSQALALVAAALESAGLVHLHVRVDERVAGFTALGVGRESRVPAVVITTSGTATANLLPAVMEADHAGVPLVVVTADRPPELRGVGANQTTRQVGMYDRHTRFSRDVDVPTASDDDGSSAQTAALRALADEAMDAALGIHDLRGPVHVNVPLREPLSGDVPEWLADACTPLPVREPEVPAAVVLERGPRTVVIAGADAGPDAEEAAHLGGWPLIAEITSGARYGRKVVHGYRELLREPDLGGAVQRALVLGHPTLSREVTALLSRPDVEVVAVDGPGERLNLNGETLAAGAVDIAAGPADREWLGRWMRASRDHVVDIAPPAPDAEGLSSVDARRRLPALAVEVEVFRAGIDRQVLVDAVWHATWPHDRLLFGSSRLVRVADAILPGKKVPVHANRGLGGIDGTVATGFGIAAASQATGAAGVTRVLLGDVTFLHDVGALLLPEGEPAPRLQVIVGNDGGGTIFDDLEVAATADAAAYDRVMYTPQQVSLEHLAAAYGWSYQKVTTRAKLDQVLTTSITGRQIVEVPLER